MLQSSGWPDLWGVAWRPDGREVWFTAADRREYKSLRAITLDGHERVVTRMLGQVTLHDISRDGQVLIAREDLGGELVVRAPGAANERSLTWLSQSVANGLSSDGSRVLFSELSLASDYGEFIYLRPTDGSPAVRLGDGQGIALSPDGKWALAFSSDMSRLVVLPTGPGAITDLTRPGFTYSRPESALELEASSYGAWLPDNRHVIFRAVVNNGARSLFVQEVGGEPRQIGPPGLVGEAVSPDGRTIAAAIPGGPLMLYPLDGGSPTAGKGVEKDEVAVQWSADGRSLFCARIVGLSTEVTAVNIDTGQRTVLWRLASPDPAGASAPAPVFVTRDGKSYAYSFERSLSDLYVIDGLK